MAISASTNNQDNIVRSDNEKHVFESGLSVVDSTISFNQGDLMFFDTTAKLIKHVAATADAATIIGCAVQAITNGVVNGPYQGLATQNAPREFVGPIHGVEASLTLKTGDAFEHGDKVYLADGADCQTVSSTDPGDHMFIGIFTGLVNIASATAGQKGTIKLIARYPVVSQ